MDSGSQCDEKNYLQLDDDERRHFVTQLSDVFWHLHTTRPVNVLTAPAGMPGELSLSRVFSTSEQLRYFGQLIVMEKLIHHSWINRLIGDSCTGEHIFSVFSARCNKHISCLCCDATVRLSVHLSVTEVHWLIIANLGFKFRSKYIARARMHALPHALRVHAGAREGIIAGKSGGISRYASNCLALCRC